jgi:hypothetical protein
MNHTTYPGEPYRGYSPSDTDDAITVAFTKLTGHPPLEIVDAGGMKLAGPIMMDVASAKELGQVVVPVTINTVETAGVLFDVDSYL